MTPPAVNRRRRVGAEAPFVEADATYLSGGVDFKTPPGPSATLARKDAFGVNR